MCYKKDIWQKPAKRVLLLTEVEGAAPSSQVLPPQFQSESYASLDAIVQSIPFH